MRQQEDTIATEVISASLGGAISASILYPLEVLKTKMQAGGEENNVEEDNDAISDEEKQVPSMIQYASSLYKNEGVGVFFRGIETSAFQSATEKALYFFAYQALKEGHATLTGSQDLNTASNLILGCAAEWAHLPITLPLDCWTTQIQTAAPGSKNTPLALLLNLLQAGPSKMYKGIQAYTVLCLKPALQYTIFEQVKKAVTAARAKKTLSSAEAFLLGMVARTFATIAVFPYLRAKVLLQATKSSSDTSTSETGRDNEPAISIPSMLLKMYSQGGLKLWFQGLGPELTRGVFSAALMMMIKEQIGIIVKNMIVGHKEQKQNKIRR